MVPTQALLAAMAALADPAPLPSLPSPDTLPPLTLGESMRFVHPVMTNTQNATAQAPSPHTDQPKRPGGGGGGSGSGGGAGRSAQQTPTDTPTVPQGSGGSPEQNPTNNGQGDPTNSDQASVLPPPNSPTPDPASTEALFHLTSPPATNNGGSQTTSPIVPDVVNEPVESPIETPEPGTIILFLSAAGISGGTAVRKWLKKKQ